MEWRRDRIESESRERRGRRISVEEAYKSQTAAGRSDLLVDCGPIQGSCITRSYWSSTCPAIAPTRRRTGRRRMSQTGKTHCRAKQGEHIHLERNVTTGWAIRWAECYEEGRRKLNDLYEWLGNSQDTPVDQATG